MVVAVYTVYTYTVFTVYLYIIHIMYTSAGRKFALLEGLSHDLKSAPDRFIMSILRGRCRSIITPF